MNNSLLTTSQWNRIRDLSGHTVAYRTGICIHELFEEQAHNFPDRIAVAYHDETFTYRQLDRLANQLAHVLIRHGVAPGDFVAISVDRSISMIVSVLAVLKAGAAYIPCEPGFPEKLLRFMLDDAQPQAIITESAYAVKLSHASTVQILIDEHRDLINQQSVFKPETDVVETDVAYAIFTSGSTGKRKAALIEHRSIVNAYFAWLDAYDLTPHDAVLQTASFSFDVFTGDWVRALCSGATLVINPFNLILDPDDYEKGEGLYGLIERYSVTVAEFTPPVLRTFLNYAKKVGKFPDCIRLLIVGADSWYIEEHRDVLEFCSKRIRLANSYGMTEATVDSTVYQLSDIPVSLNQISVIGKPFANTEIYMLHPDENRLLPSGEMGEICVAGPGLSRGYLNRPELTAERFVEMNFPDGITRQLYRSGDMGRFMPDGNIEFAGRKDNQVEIGSIRVELGEIEAAIYAEDSVKSAVVIAVGDSAAEHDLVCFIEVSPGINCDLQQIGESLKSQLPRYMIPNRFIVLEEFPLTSNGKIDRNRLALKHSASPSQIVDPPHDNSGLYVCR